VLGLVFLAGGASPRIAAVIPIQLSSLALFAMMLVLLRCAPATTAPSLHPAGVPAEA
jgi:hypothetical protein